MSKTKSDAARVLLDQGWDIQEVMDVLELEKVKTVVVEKVVEKPVLPKQHPWDKDPWGRPRVWLSSDNGAIAKLSRLSC